jgi:hypothetical protein
MHLRADLPADRLGIIERFSETLDLMIERGGVTALP